MGRVLVALAVAAGLALSMGVALADQAYHSEHLNLSRIGVDPLRSGFVENIHVNGPQIYAHELYVLNGAAPNTTYHVALHVDFSSSTCSSGEFTVLPSSDVETNGVGNGVGQKVFAPADIPPHEPGTTIGIFWELTNGTTGQPAYRTNCSAVTLD